MTANVNMPTDYTITNFQFSSLALASSMTLTTFGYNIYLMNGLNKSLFMENTLIQTCSK